MSATIRPTKTVEVTISAQNTFTNWLRLDGPGVHDFVVNFVETVATFAATCVVQGRRVLSDGTTGETQTILSTTDLTDFPSLGTLIGTWEVRAGVATGGYTSGTGRASINA